MTSPIGDFAFRRVRREDKAEVLDFTSATWDFGDYIEDVFDSWLEDGEGLFLVAEEVSSRRIAAIDKLTMLSAEEAWFEGLRVNAAFRGHGMATSLQHHMIDEAKRRGARTVRFLTLIENYPIHRNAYRDGFSVRCMVRHWTWENQSGSAYPALNAPSAARRLRQVPAHEVPSLFRWWLRSAAFSSHGLIHHNWSFAAPSETWWAEQAQSGCVFVLDDTSAPQQVLPPATVVISRQIGAEGKPIWGVSAFSAQGIQVAELASALIAEAKEQQVGEISGLLPDTADLLIGLKQGGFVPSDEQLYLFELVLERDD